MDLTYHSHQDLKIACVRASSAALVSSESVVRLGFLCNNSCLPLFQVHLPYTPQHIITSFLFLRYLHAMECRPSHTPNILSSFWFLPCKDPTLSTPREIYFTSTLSHPLMQESYNDTLAKDVSPLWAYPIFSSSHSSNLSIPGSIYNF